MIITNAIEELVIEEVRRQVDLDADFGGDMQQLSEVLVTALNLVPPLYACSEQGWLQQRKRAYSKMTEQIATAVQIGKAQVKSKPIAYPLPLTLHEIRRSCHCLVKLREIFNKPDLTWKDLPEVLEKALQKICQDREDRSLNPPSRPRESFNVTVLQAPKVSHPRYEEDLEFYSYIVSSPFSLVNVLEKVVSNEAQRRIKQMGNTLSREIRLEDAVCFTLNRVPPIYVSHMRAYRRENNHIAKELMTEIQQRVVDSLISLNNSPKRMTTYLPLIRFEKEFRQVLPEIPRILGTNKQLSVGNIVDNIDRYLQTPERLQTQLGVMLDELCEAFQLIRSSAGLKVQQNKDGSISLHADWFLTAWTLADQSHLVAYIALKHFPEITGLIVTNPELEEPIHFSKEELLGELARFED